MGIEPLLMESGGLWGAPLRVFEDLPSTNTWLLEQGERCRHGEIVRARRQSAGRGRSGRQWFGGAGLTFSAAFQCSECVPAPEYQGAVAALALAFWIERQGFEPALKWPNDVLVDGRKLAGILGEVRSDAPDIMVVGIGCNINEQSGDFSANGLAGMAVSPSMLSGRIYDLEAVLAEILSVWQATIDMVAHGGLAALAGEWRARDLLAGRFLRADVGGHPLEGWSAGVDDELALRIRDEKGVEHLLRSGEVVHVGGAFF